MVDLRFFALVAEPVRLIRQLLDSSIGLFSFFFLLVMSCMFLLGIRESSLLDTFIAFIGDTFLASIPRLDQLVRVPSQLAHVHHEVALLIEDFVSFLDSLVRLTHISSTIPFLFYNY